MSTVCAIHQPNFFPWLGYFDKIKRADKFVFLDDVQIIKKGSSYTNRVLININGSSKYFTAPIERNSGLNNINKSFYKDDAWRVKFVKTIQNCYGKSKNYKKYAEMIIDIINFEDNNISSYNINAIKALSNIIGIDTKDKFISSSILNIVSSSTQRLIDICKNIDSDSYLSGEGGKKYQDNDLFQVNGIDLVYQDYTHPVYYQRAEEFIKGLSVLDYIFEAL